MPAEPSPVVSYIAAVTDDRQRAALEDLRAMIKAVVPNAEEVISYNLPAFRFEGKVVAGFAANKKHLSYYPFSGHTKSEFADELADFDGTAEQQESDRQDGQEKA